MTRDDKALAAVFAKELPEDSAETSQAVNRAVENAESRALIEVKRAAARRGIKIDDRATTLQAVNDLQVDKPETPLTVAVAARLRASSGADALLRFRITDYGLMPRSWRKAYIAFEVVSTLAIAAIAYSLPRTRPIAGIYLVEEGIEETVEGYAGFWAFNEVARPVRIETELLALDSGLVWRESATGFSDIRVSRLWREVDAAELDTQLRTATREAVEKTFSHLGDPSE